MPAIAVRNARCYDLFMSGAGGNSASRPTVDFPTGVTMKLSISYKHVDLPKPVEAEVGRHVEKLNRLLKSYEPDLVQLHGAFSQNNKKHERSFAVNLTLPTGSLHATGTAENDRGCCKRAFSELENQVKKHQSILRKDYEWKRKRPLTKPALEEI
jgi:ribosome-associated translation inhibitor RaiA